MASSEKHTLILSDDQLLLIDQSLNSLRYNTGAKCVILSDVTGQPITQVGVTEGLDIANLISLLAGSFAVIFEMSKYLGEKNTSNLNFHEGPIYAVYSANVGDKLFMAIFYERRVKTGRIGMDWLYIRRTVPKLIEIIAASGKNQGGSVIDADFSASLNEKMDRLFD
jgi:hypothetical protein